MKQSLSKVVLSSAVLMGLAAPAAAPVVQAETVTANATVIVNNEKGEVVKNEAIKLVNSKTVIKAMTDAEGKAVIPGLTAGMHYKILVAGIEMTNAYAQTGQSVRVYVDSAALAKAKAQGVTFNAYVINNQYQYVKGQSVRLVDITTGRKVYATKKNKQLLSSDVLKITD